MQHHEEEHFTAGEVVRDVVIGMADGLTVPFALAAGLAGAVDSTAIVVTAGLAEIAAGAIAMGLGGYLAGRSEVEHYASERAREEAEIKDLPEVEAQEVREILEGYGLGPQEAHTVVESLRRRPKAWIDFMMKFELGLDKPDPRRALFSGMTIGGAYVVGGMIPLAPYMLIGVVGRALVVSAIITAVALLAFGFGKAKFTGMRPLKSALQTAVIGGVAATVAFLVARLIS